MNRTMFFRSKQKPQDRAIADAIYTGIVDASRQPEFFLSYGIPDTLDGRFEMLSLHMFLGLKRLVENGGDDKALAQTVMELFVRDMDAALRELGVSDIKVPKRMKTLYGSFGGRIGGYTLAAADGGSAMHEALARNVFPDGGEVAHVEALAAYVAAVLQDFDALEADKLRNGAQAFRDAVSFKPGE
jgi:cytochrome b pre-mRNA-processing protein 3